MTKHYIIAENVLGACFDEVDVVVVLSKRSLSNNKAYPVLADGRRQELKKLMPYCQNQSYYGSMQYTA